MAEVIISAKTVEAAVELGTAQLGVDAASVKYEVLEEGKKGIFGIGAQDAKVRVYSYAENYDYSNCEFKPQTAKPQDDCASAALSLLQTIINDMGINAEAKIVKTETVLPAGKSIPEKNIYVEIEGERLGSLIGRHGDVLDALQYLANIAAGRKAKSGDDKKEYVKICLDIENYRGKREETLKALARRMADKVVRYGRSVTLEPMLAYERKIIHAELQNYDGVYTYSIGSDSSRRIVIELDDGEDVYDHDAEGSEE